MNKRVGIPRCLTLKDINTLFPLAKENKEVLWKKLQQKIEESVAHILPHDILNVIYSYIGSHSSFSFALFFTEEMAPIVSLICRSTKLDSRTSYLMFLLSTYAGLTIYSAIMGVPINFNEDVSPI